MFFAAADLNNEKYVSCIMQRNQSFNGKNRTIGNGDLSPTIDPAPDTVARAEPTTVLVPHSDKRDGDGEVSTVDVSDSMTDGLSNLDHLSGSRVNASHDDSGTQVTAFVGQQDHGQETQPTFEWSGENKSFDVDETILREGVNRKGLEDHIETLIQNPKGKGKSGPFEGVVGDYQILGELGRGGMGVVYKARHRKLERIVALKMILNGKHSGDSALKRFVSEARAVAHLQHPGIVQIFDIGEHNGLPYFSLEFVEGRDLHKDLNGTPRDAKSSAEMVEQLAITMQYAHDNKILHRDLKPANILLDAGGKPKITDFGLAKQVDTEGSLATNDGTILGSPSYMPPEQARGDISSMTPRSDLYSLGAILYQMLTARPPFITDRPLETIMQVMNNEPVQPRELQPGIPIDLETICMKALQKDQTVRYGSCKELAEDLRRFIDGKPILARPVGRIERVVRWCKRNPKVAIPSVAAGFFFIATTFISTWAWRESSANAVIIADERDNVKEERDKAQKERDEADRQRVLANEATLQAEKNQKIAETQANLALQNIQLVLTEVDTRLAKQPGTADIRIGILQLMEKKWDELDKALTGGIEGQSIPTLMRVRFQIADAWVSLDRLKEADAQFTTIYEQAKERIVVKNRSDASRFNLALVCNQWSPIKQRLTGNPEESKKLYDESAALLREILRDPRPEPNSPQLYSIVSSLRETLMSMASASSKLGKLAKALSAYEEAESISKKIDEEIASNATWFTALATERQSQVRMSFSQYVDLARTGKANTLIAVGKSAEAIEIYEDLLKKRRLAVEQKPTEPSEKDLLAVQLQNYGKLMLKVNRLDDAARLLGEANDLSETLFNLDPKNARYKRTFGHSQFYLGTVRDAQGMTSDAVALFERSRVLRAEMVANSPDQSNKVNLMLAESRLGNIDATQSLVDELAKSNKKDPDLRLDIARSLAQLTRRADGDLRNKLREASLAALDRCVEDGLSDPFPIANEPDLVPLRGDERFKSTIAKLTSLRK